MENSIYGVKLNKVVFTENEMEIMAKNYLQEKYNEEFDIFFIFQSGDEHGMINDVPIINIKNFKKLSEVNQRDLENNLDYSEDDCYFGSNIFYKIFKGDFEIKIIHGDKAIITFK